MDDLARQIVVNCLTKPYGATYKNSTKKKQTPGYNITFYYFFTDANLTLKT